MDVINNNNPPSGDGFSQVAYFKAWNYKQPCLHINTDKIKEPYTHIYFAFANISEDFVPSDKGVESQFKKFININTKLKQIISFGGWAFFNKPGTGNIIHEGVKTNNRKKFTDNIAKFVKDNKLDGVDFDWEYPSADNIPGSEPGGPDNGVNYLEFLKLVQDKMLDDKSLSITAPAFY